MGKSAGRRPSIPRFRGVETVTPVVIRAPLKGSLITNPSGIKNARELKFGLVKTAIGVVNEKLNEMK